MEISRVTIPGVGHSYECLTRGGQRFGVLVEHSGRRTLLVYAGLDLVGHDSVDHHSVDHGEPEHRIALDPDEGDQLADLLHQRSIADRLAELERRMAELPRNRA